MKQYDNRNLFNLSLSASNTGSFSKNIPTLQITKDLNSYSANRIYDK